MQVYFGHQKNDQEGERPKDPRHVFPNPVNPAVCPVLSLAIYLLCTGFEEEPNKLFPGGKQYDRYHKALKRLLEDPVVKAELKGRGIDPSQIGTHSVRKGAATYCASGLTAGPSMAAIQLRAGWTLEGVQNRYIRYEGAGDQVVGRTVSGLPYTTVDFAILPPFFRVSGDLLKTAIDECFPRAPETLHGVLKFCVASVLHHTDFLRATLPANHLLFSTPLFRPQFAPLRADVVCRLYEAGDPIRPTGALSAIRWTASCAVVDPQRLCACACCRYSTDGNIDAGVSRRREWNGPTGDEFGKLWAANRRAPGAAAGSTRARVWHDHCVGPARHAEVYAGAVARRCQTAAERQPIGSSCAAAGASEFTGGTVRHAHFVCTVSRLSVGAL
jgi:hypothetical protein